MPKPGGTPSRWKIRWAIGVVVLVIWVTTVLCSFSYERLALRAIENRVTYSHGPADPLFALKMRGIDRPPILKASASKVRPDEEVIGVLIDGKARAYRLDVFRERSQHVVNDLVQGKPVTVSYCDLNECVRVFTDPRSSEPLPVSIAGLYEGGELVLDLGGTLYFQKSGDRLDKNSGPAVIPLERLAPTRTTWERWRQAHPDTDIYEGQR